MRSSTHCLLKQARRRKAATPLALPARSRPLFRYVIAHPEAQLDAGERQALVQGLLATLGGDLDGSDEEMEDNNGADEDGGRGRGRGRGRGGNDGRDGD